MPKVLLDTSGYSERSPLEAGVYDAVIDTNNEDCVVKTSERSGAQYIPVKFIVATDSGDRTLTRNFNVTGKGVYYTLKFLHDMGLWDGDKENAAELDTRKLHGMRCKIKVSKSVNDNGREVNDIEAVVPVGAGENGARTAKRKTASF